MQRDKQLRDLSTLKMSVRDERIGFSIRNMNVRGKRVFVHVAAASVGRHATLLWRCAHAARSRRTIAVDDHCFREAIRVVFAFHSLARLFIAGIASHLRWPNKALQPTRTSVTRRARSCAANFEHASRYTPRAGCARG